MQNPIDKDKVADLPGLMAYPHTIGSIEVKPEDEGKLKSRALSAMREQTHRQLHQLQRQAELIARQAQEIAQRVAISEEIYLASLSFEPFVGHVYHLYRKNDQPVLMLVGPTEWGKSMPSGLTFVNSVRLLSDHTWEILYTEDLQNTSCTFS